ncbi:conserved hypothetical protein [Hyphomicrobiales bacterium]|nr:conserved hypothetical protein [Hyphomicrobiales bacterium]CAH1697246.1 conserved hypothetical protein [Hyphomicrobiales bacterium]CAI0342814.1 conserved hypothetical protein [Hyphomicrobiales bacterium]
MTEALLPTVAGATDARTFMAGSMAMAAIHLEHALAHIALGDTTALLRSAQKFAVCAAAAVETLPEAVKEMDAEGGAHV